MTQDFIHLHTHDEYSLLDGCGKVTEFADRAKELGFPAMAITNHGNVDGAIQFQENAIKRGHHPIIGCELYLAEKPDVKEKGDIRKHITVIAKNETGWRNLLKMLTKANLDWFYYKPRLSPQYLVENSEGLIVMSGCANCPSDTPWGVKMYRKLVDEIAGDLYFEVMPHPTEMQTGKNRLAIEMARRYGGKLVATNDCHYPAHKDERRHEVLLAIQTKTTMSDPDRWKFDVGGLYLKTTDEMVKSFLIQQQLSKSQTMQAIATTAEIYEKCKGFTIPKRAVELPNVPGYGGDQSKQLWKLVKAGWEERKSEGHIPTDLIPEYKERVDEEMGLICKQGFQTYFIIVTELIGWCRENSILTGPGRGSVGGSLVAWLLHITAVDPIRWKLLFSRFISPARIDFPDIDMDFPDNSRDRVRRHLEEVYGVNNVCGLSTFGSMKGRSALRDVGRVFEVPRSDVDKASKSIVVRSGGDFRSDFTIADAFETFDDGIAFKAQYPEVTQLASEFEGQIRGVGQHAAAICITKDDLRDGTHCSLARRGEVVVANWDKHDSEHVGLMKLDVLGLSALTVIQTTLEMIKAHHKKTIVLEQIPLDDKDTLKDISDGHTVGVFQLGSKGLQKFCQDLGVEKFDDVVNATSLWRPGTLRSGMTNEFVRRKKGITKWEPKNEYIRQLTADTYGIIVYQEQVMKLSYELAGMSWRTADVIRKVISKSQGDELFMKFKREFVDGCVKKQTLSAEDAGKMWEELSSFGSYSFNLSHAVEYSLISYWDAYLKHYWPAEFLACSLTVTSDPADKQELVRDARRLGLEIETPKFGKSDAEKWLVVGNTLHVPFSEIKGIRTTICEELARMASKPSRKGFYKLESATEGANKRIINKNVKAMLDRLAVFEERSLTDEELYKVADLFPFNITRDQMYEVRGIYNLLQQQGYVRQLKGADHGEKMWLIGRIEEVKYGYRKNVLKARQEGTSSLVAGTRDAMGGVYGFFEDESDKSMSVITGSLYAAKKNLVEHCGAQWLLVHGQQDKVKAASMMVDQMYNEEDLLGCNFGGAGFHLVNRKVDRSDTTAVVGELCACDACSLRKECTRPVMPSTGAGNIMVIGEAPGKDEDRAGIGFVGRSGNALWAELALHGFSRQHFHVTNAVKCWPAASKTPDRRQVSKCKSLWLDKEFEAVKPVMALVFGNTAVKTFTDDDSGIMKLSGTTTWDGKMNAWLCWSIHPASVLYDASNRELFSRSIKNFADTIKRIL